MPRFLVTAKWYGEAETIIEADDEDAAEEKARTDTWCGFLVEGGEVELEILDVEQTE